MDFSVLLILMVFIWTIGRIFRMLKLPVVFGELIGGIIVGPAVLGMVPTDCETIKIIAELGIFFMMLHVGMETDPKEIFGCSKKSVLIALGGVLLPFTGGFLTARLFGQPLISSLFIGMGLSVSAIAVAARLFKDCGIQNTRVAHLTLGAAIFDDIFALILFSVIISLAEAGTVSVLHILYLLAKIILFFGVVIYGGMKLSPHMNKLIYLGNKGFTLTLIIALIMGLVAEAIGLHIIMGAFLAGLFMREELIDKKVFAKIEDRVYGLSYSFFGPIFFASLAFHLDFTAIKTMPLFLTVILAVAIAGKVIGGGAVSWLLKVKPIESLAIGLSLNNRGAVELIIASVGLQMGIIDTNIFSALVMMAFLTTVFSIIVMTPVAKRIKQFS